MTTLKGTLKHGLKVGDKVYVDYVLRPATTGDFFDAEDDAPISKNLSFKAAMMGRQLVKLGELSGPIDFKIMRKLEIEDFNQIVDDMKKVDEMGKKTPSD